MRIDGTLTLKQPRLNHDHHTQCKIQLSTLTFWYRWVCHEGSGKIELWLILKICIHFSDRFEASLNQFVVNKLLSLNLLCLPLPESCRSPNGRNGQCTLFNNCAVLFNMYNQQPNNNQVINFLIASQRNCGNRNSNRTPIVCCEQVATVQTTPAPTNGGSPCTEPQGRSGVCQSKNRVIFPDKILINIFLQRHPRLCFGLQWILDAPQRSCVHQLRATVECPLQLRESERLLSVRFDNCSGYFCARD